MSLTLLSRLLPLPDEELQQVLDYAHTLSKADAASHFSNLLGDSPQAVDFIASFNSARRDPGPDFTRDVTSAPTESVDAVPKTKRGTKKKKPPLHALEARKLDDHAAPSGNVYNKKDQDLDYIAERAMAPSGSRESRSTTPKLQEQPKQQHHTSAGYLISDSTSKHKSKSNPVSRTGTPKPSTKVSITGGMPMAGASTAIADLDAAIRALEISTNPTLDNPATRKCNCVATRHPLQGAAPNCLSCGKVVCMKEGLGPCTFCGTPLLSSGQVQDMMRELREERGREKMAADAESHRRPGVTKTPIPFSRPQSGSSTPSIAEAEAKAREHRDKLLNFQAQNARRTTVRDEAADFDFGGPVGGSMWASPEERARELKRQQKLAREMEWNARPEYEKRQQVMSIDLVGGKVVRRMAKAERPASPDAEAEETADNGIPDDKGALRETNGNRGGGAFSGNPLLGGLIKPRFEADNNGKGKGKEVQGRPQTRTWRRVQDDRDDNEGVILDGGVYGGQGETQSQGDEPPCG